MTTVKLSGDEKRVHDLLLKAPAAIEVSTAQIARELDLDPQRIEKELIPSLQEKGVHVVRWMSGWRIPGHAR